MNVRELCCLLSATLHLPDIERWAERLVDRELLPSLDHEVTALDAALLLMAVVAASRPTDASRVVVMLANLPLVFVESKVGRGNYPTWVPGSGSSNRRPADGRTPFSGTTLPDGHFGARRAAETLGFFGSLCEV